MQPHIQQTIADIRAVIIRHEELIAFLEDFGNGESNTHIPGAPALTPSPHRDLTHTVHLSGNGPRAKAVARPLKPTGGGARRGLDHKTVKTLAKFSTLPEQFTIKQMYEAGVSDSTVYRYLTLKWLDKPSVGVFRRTSKMPTLAPGAPAAVPAGKPIKRSPLPAVLTEDARVDMEQKLSDACRQRDHARANGRDTVVDVFQQDIDRLEAQLGRA